MSKIDLTAPDRWAEEWDRNDRTSKNHLDYRFEATSKRFWDHRTREAARVRAIANDRWWRGCK